MCLTDVNYLDSMSNESRGKRVPFRVNESLLVRVPAILNEPRSQKVPSSTSES